jgi:hypothetical protein
MDWGGATFWGALGWAFTAAGLLTYYAAGLAYARAARHQLAVLRAGAARAAAQDDDVDRPAGGEIAPDQPRRPGQ